MEHHFKVTRRVVPERRGTWFRELGTPRHARERVESICQGGRRGFESLLPLREIKKLFRRGARGFLDRSSFTIPSFHPPTSHGTTLNGTVRATTPFVKNSAFHGPSSVASKKCQAQMPCPAVPVYSIGTLS
jgi:hypothetical protein